MITFKAFKTSLSEVTRREKLVKKVRKKMIKNKDGVNCEPTLDVSALPVSATSDNTPGQQNAKV